MIELLARWRRNWGARPVAVVAMPSAQHPKLVRSLASHVAALGRLPLLDALQLKDSAAITPAADAASGDRATFVFQLLEKGYVALLHQSSQRIGSLSLSLSFSIICHL